MKISLFFDAAIFILSLIMIVRGISALVKKDMTHRKIDRMPKQLRQKAISIYGVGRIICGIGGIVLGLSLIKQYIGFSIPNIIGLIIICGGLAVQIYAQNIKK